MKQYSPMILLKDRILVLPDVTEEKTASGLYIPELAKEKPVQGTIIAVSALVTSLKVGDKITYGKYTGTNLTWDEEEMLIMHETDPFGLVHE